MRLAAYQVGLTILFWAVAYWLTWVWLPDPEQHMALAKAVDPVFRGGVLTIGAVVFLLEKANKGTIERRKDVLTRVGMTSIAAFYFFFWIVEFSDGWV